MHVDKGGVGEGLFLGILSSVNYPREGLLVFSIVLLCSSLTSERGIPPVS